MACVEAAIPVPDSRKKVDELFLYWLSEPSTQEMLRKELSSICDVPCSELDDLLFKQDGTVVLSSIVPHSVTGVLRPGSPTTRTPSPPPSSLVAKSPSSPRARRSSRKSPHGSNLKEKLQLTTAAKSKLSTQLLQQWQLSGTEEVDGGVPEVVEQPQNVPSISVTSSEQVHGGSGEPLESKGSASARGEGGPPGRSRSPKPSSLPPGPAFAKPLQVCDVHHHNYCTLM